MSLAAHMLLSICLVVILIQAWPHIDWESVGKMSLSGLLGLLPMLWLYGLIPDWLALLPFAVVLLWFWAKPRHYYFGCHSFSLGCRAIRVHRFMLTYSQCHAHKGKDRLGRVVNWSDA